MSGASFEPASIPAQAWHQEATQDLLRGRRAGDLFRLAQKYGMSQMRIAALTGQSQGRVNDLIHGRRGNITALDAWERIADGLDMPDHARIILGLAPRGAIIEPHASTIDTDLGLAFPVSPENGIETVAELWRADLEEATVLTTVKPSNRAWNDASLKWLLAAPEGQRFVSSGSHRVGDADVQRIRLTTDMFATMDNRFGGGHARRSLIQFLATDADEAIHGSFTEITGQALFSAVAEATLLAAWMAYDSGLHSLAQRYFIQALGFAEAGHDRLLAGSILDAMSHQATYIGRYREGADLARAARMGTQSVATPTLTAHFHVMEARALARLNDATGCDSALTAATTEFERRNSDDDPEWIRYFDEAELAAEFGHCFRDLGRPVDATSYISQCARVGDGSYQRSDFFATMVLADAHLRSGDVEQACQVAQEALKLGEHLKSARCISYLREFRTELNGVQDAAVVHEFTDQVADVELWQQADVVR